MSLEAPIVAYERLTREYHRLLAGGLHGSAAALTLENEMAAVWDRLTLDEQERMHELNVELRVPLREA